uniref:WSC domain-containing protein n=1 Tax=Gongylonema pulchrum TaxID=637853 RepID=A0A183EL02_9BILA
LLKVDKTERLSDSLDGSKRGIIVWMSGSGANLFSDSEKEENCEQCLLMTGQLSNVSSSGGVCPVVSVWKIQGGYGGGGASCGPGGGGGAGGEGGQKYHGSGGKSFAQYKHAIITAGINNGNGYVLIYPCRLQCSSNATCRFRLDTADEVVSYCVCPDGREIGEFQDCTLGAFQD